MNSTQNNFIQFYWKFSQSIIVSFDWQNFMRSPKACTNIMISPRIELNMKIRYHTIILNFSCKFIKYLLSYLIHKNSMPCIICIYKYMCTKVFRSESHSKILLGHVFLWHTKIFKWKWNNNRTKYINTYVHIWTDTVQVYNHSLAFSDSQ